MTTLAQLRPGDVFRHAFTCGRYQPLYYAAASGDFNPIHLDPDVARKVGLDAPILQGMCTLGWLATACTAPVGDPGGLARLSVRFSRPVAIGDSVTFEGRCAAVEGGVARLEIGALNGRGEEVLKGARAEVRLGGAPPPVRASAPPPVRHGAAADPRVGRRYGPFRYEVGVEKVREFAVALAGAAPGRIFVRPPDPPPHPWHVDPDAARASPYGAIIAPPTFAAVTAMQTWATALTDPANGIDFLRVLHGEQDLRWHGVMRAGDTLETTGEISAVARKGPLEIVDVTSRTVNQRGELVVEGVWTAVVR